MATEQNYKREPNGTRFEMGGMNTVLPPDALPPGKYPYLQNVRRYLQGRMTGRATQASASITLGAAVHSLRRLNDSTPAYTGFTPPTSGYSLIGGAATSLYCNALPTATGLSGNPLALVPFRPNSSPQPWMYVGDSSEAVTIFSNAGGVATMTTSSPLGNWIWGMLWSGFPVPSLPSDATVQGIYAVIVASYTCTTNPHAEVNAGYGTALTPWDISPGETGVLFNNTAGNFSGEYVSDLGALTSLGTSLSLLATQQLYARLDQSLGIATLDDVLTVTAVGYAIYYTTTTTAPSIAPEIPPPFAVPSGQSLAWSLPSVAQAYSQTGEVNPTNGSASAYAGALSPATGMLKVRSDGLTYKMGVKEPQSAPAVGSGNYTTSGTFNLQATTLPWSNRNGLNPSFSFGENATDGTLPSAIPTHNIPGSTLTITVTGTATVNGASHAPGDAGPTGSSNPGHYVASPSMVVGAWTDASGEIIALAGSQTVNIGAGATLTVPVGAYQLLLGVNGTANGFSANTGAFAVSFNLTVTALSTAITTIGNVTAYYWGDSPHSGPVTHYIWRSASDSSGSGPIRDISTAAGSITGNSLIFDAPTMGDGTTPMAWSVLDGTGAVIGTKSVFQPALESEGYQDFNLCVVGNLYFPAAGVYTLTIASTNETMWGIGNNATWAASGAVSSTGQTKTVVNGLPLLPCALGGGNVSVDVTVSGAGLYPIELNYDYWDKSGRTMVVKAAAQGSTPTTIAPVAATVKEGVQYRYTFRSSVTGATSNPSPESPAQQVPSLANTVTAGEYSTDPQVDKVDFYRMDTAVTNFTYVGTVDNTSTPTLFSDQLLDADIAGNPLLQFDNYEPFPSIDLPRKGTVTVTGGGTVSWVSGDTFNLRWLPGTLINIGGIDYTLYNRPQSATQLTIIDGADSAVAQAYEIAEPTLAAQSSPSMWGNSDNAAYMFAIDPLNPGDLVFCKGNNLDSAPDTNRINVTSPSEPLINGVMANGIGMVFSSENGWIIYPNFTSALATITGVEGDAFSLIRSGVTRGLYIRPAICTDGSGAYFYRSKDGVEMSVAGGKQQSTTDQDLYNLFPHEGYLPQPVTLAGCTVYPPDDTQPELQKLRFATGYLYYDYVDTASTPRTLVYDVAGGGWVVDVYQYPATVHMLEEGPDANGVLIGCNDGSVRALVSGGSETATCVCLTPAVNGGDARANKTVGDLFVRASVSGSAVAVAPYANQFATALAGFSPSTLAVGSGLQPYILDFTDGQARDVSDIEMLLSWLAGTATYLDLWQPDWTSLPESTQDRPTDWTDGGATGTMFWQGLTLEADTFGNPKAIAVQSADDLSLHVPDQSPVTFNGQSKQALTFTPPFIAHSVRIVTTDGVPWRYFGANWVALPFPSSVPEWQTEITSLGNAGWQHIREMNVAHVSTVDLTLTLVFDPGAVPASITLTVPNSAGAQAKTKITCPANKFKLVSFRLNCASPFRVFAGDCECKVGTWGRESGYRNLKIIGGESAGGASL